MKDKLLIFCFVNHRYTWNLQPKGCLFYLKFWNQFNYKQTFAQRPWDCSMVVVVQRWGYVSKTQIGTAIWWSLLACGRFSEIQAALVICGLFICEFAYSHRQKGSKITIFQSKLDFLSANSDIQNFGRGEGGGGYGKGPPNISMGRMGVSQSVTWHFFNKKSAAYWCFALLKDNHLVWNCQEI